MSTSSSSGGIGFFGLLAITFIVLKLVGVIDWAWFWVLAPIWAPLNLLLIIFVTWALIVFFSGGKARMYIRRKR